MKFYVYVILDPRKRVAEPIYVGKGTMRGRRAVRPLVHLSGRSSNPLLKNVIKRIRDEGEEPAVKIVQKFQDEEKALSMERKLIAKYGRRDLGEGPLTNLLDGGDGAVRWVYPAWLRKKKSIEMKIRNADQNFKKSLSKASKAAWDNPDFRKRCTDGAKNYQRTPEARAKTSKRFKRLWKDKEFREIQIRNIIEVNSRPDVRRIKAEKSAKSWADPKIRAARSKGISTALNKIAYRKAKSIETSNKWKDPEHRAMRCAAISRGIQRAKEMRAAA